MTSLNKFLMLGSAALFVVAVPAMGQGSATTGTIVTGSDVAGGAFSPAGTVGAEASPAVAIATATAGTSITTSLSAGGLTTVSGAPIPGATQTLILTVINSGSPAATATLATALGASGVSVEANALAEAMSNLISSPGTGQLASAVGHYNALVQGADAAFLQNPPAEFLAVQAVLAGLVSAAGSAQ
jgi:hypothetical protein